MTDQLPTDASDAAGLLQAYVDGELSIEESTLVARFLEESPSARTIVRQQNEVRVRLASLPKSTAPAGLRSRILIALDDIDSGANAVDSQHALPLAAGSDLGGARGRPRGGEREGAGSARGLLRVITGGVGRGLLMVAPALLAAGVLFQAARVDQAPRGLDDSARANASAGRTPVASPSGSPPGQAAPRIPQLDGIDKANLRIDSADRGASVARSGDGITLVSNHAPDVTSAIVQYVDAQDGRLLVDVQSPADRVKPAGQELELDDGTTLMVRVDGSMLIAEFVHEGVVHSLRTRAVAATQEHQAALLSLAKLATALGNRAMKPAQRDEQP